MMPNRSTDILFQLIKSLEKAEKRHFKLYIKRSSGKEDLKIVRLFDALDKLKEYDEKIFAEKTERCYQATAGQSQNTFIQTDLSQPSVTKKCRQSRPAVE